MTSHAFCWDILTVIVGFTGFNSCILSAAAWDPRQPISREGGWNQYRGIRWASTWSLIVNCSYAKRGLNWREFCCEFCFNFQTRGKLGLASHWIANTFETRLLEYVLCFCEAKQGWVFQKSHFETVIVRSTVPEQKQRLGHQGYTYLSPHCSRYL